MSGIVKLAKALGVKLAPQDEALRVAQENAVKMLGLPPGNTPMDRARAMEARQAFHATPNEYHSIDLDRAGKVSGGNVRAFFATPDSSIANDYVQTQLVPKPEFASAYRKADKYDKALFSKYDEFSRQPDFFLSMPAVGSPAELVSALSYGSGKQVAPIFQQFVGNDRFLSNMAKNKQTVNKLIADADKSKPTMHIEAPVQGSNVMPLMVRDKDFIEFDARGEAWSPDLDRKIQSFIREIGEAPAGVNIKNVIDSETGKRGTTQMIFDPSRVRSRFAAFDPARINENNLLASRLLPFALPGLLSLPMGDNE